MYERHFLYLRDNYGAATFHTITEPDVRAIRNELAARPSVADAIVNKIGLLWQFAKELLEMKLGVDPTREVAAIHTETESAKAWPEELCAAIERHPNPGVVRGYYLLRYTGQRRSDVTRMKWKQFDGTAVELFQVKTGTYVWVPAHKRLIEHLAPIAASTCWRADTSPGTTTRALAGWWQTRAGAWGSRATPRRGCAIWRARRLPKRGVQFMRSCQSWATSPRSRLTRT